MRVGKKILALAMAGVIFAGTAGAGSTASAASSDSWSINYKSGAPTNISKRTDVLYMAYCSDGYKGECKTIDGSQGRELGISSGSCGGIKVKGGSIPVTKKGPIAVWVLKNSTTENVSFLVTAKEHYNCTSTGIIKIAH